MKSLVKKNMVGWCTAGAICFMMLGCRTMSPTVRVSKEEKQITVYSSSDKNSALVDPKSTGAIRDSMKVVKEKLNKQPDNPDLLLDLANLQLVIGNYKEARDTCRRALAYNLKNAAGRKLLGRIELEGGDQDKAEIILNSLGGANSKDSDILNSLGIIALNRKDYPQAFDLFNRGIKISPDNVALRMNLGTLYMKFKQVQPASVQFERVLQIIPEHADALLHLGIASSYRGDFKKSEELYRKVLERDRNNIIVRYNLALAQKSQGNFKEALSNVKVFLKQRDVGEEKYRSAELLRDQIENEIERLKKIEEEKNKQLETKTLSAKPLKAPEDAPAPKGLNK